MLLYVPVFSAREEPQHQSQVHYTNVEIKVQFTATTQSPVPILNETFSSGRLGELAVIKGSFTVLREQGFKEATPPVPTGSPATNSAAGDTTATTSNMPSDILGGCEGTRYGCCLDGNTAAMGPDGEGCPEGK